jgi:hypothetical protein
MSDEPKKLDDTWLGQAKAEGWHMTEVALPERPDDRAWRTRVAWRVVEVAVLVATLCVVSLDLKVAATLTPAVCMAIWAAESYARSRRSA